jgi:alkaline phosphatase
MMKRLRLICAFLLWVSAPLSAWAQERPNIIVFLADDLGWADLACYGSDLHETPHLDGLARTGVKFTDAYSACTVCSPTRASLLTGKYPARLHVTDWIAGHERPQARLRIPDWTKQLNHEYVTLAEVLQQAGYQTAHIGKWHLGPDTHGPTSQGFQVNIGGTSAGSPPGGYFLPNQLDLPGAKEGEYLTDHLTDRAIELIETWREKSFFLYLPSYAVHTPIQAKPDLSEHYREKIEPEHKHRNADYAAMVHNLDENIGRVLAKLDELKLTERTLVIFTSDNGGLTQVNGRPTGVTNNTPLRRGKGSAYEGGVRVPLIVRGPGVAQDAVCDEPAMTVDLFPTVAEWAGVALPEDAKTSLDGVSLAAVLPNPEGTVRREALYWHYPHYHPGGDGPYSAVRAGDWKLIEHLEDGRLELFNLREDLGEQKDLAEERPEHAKQLLAQLTAWRQSVGAQMPTENPSYDPGRATEAAPRKKARPKKKTNAASSGSADAAAASAVTPSPDERPDVRQLQTTAIESKQADWGHWGADPTKYSSWTSHSNRLIPVYTYGINLDNVRKNNAYHSEQRLIELYGRLPDATLNPKAEYFDQTAMYALQEEALAAGKKHIILIVFDGMDWQTTAAAAYYKSGKIYREGRGSGLFWQDYRGAETDFGFFVTSPWSNSEGVDVDAQTVADVDRGLGGGYDPILGGAEPWAAPTDPRYLLGQNRNRRHGVTDSASSATSLTAGIKTYNAAINVAHDGSQVTPIARELQANRGFSIGVVTNVPISHATPACAYSNNVTRNDYQDLTRDLLGLPSIAHRDQPTPGVEVLLGAGWGEVAEKEEKQGANYIPGNRFLAPGDRVSIDAAQGGRYIVAERTPGQNGAQLLAAAAQQAVAQHKRLFGFFGVTGGHLPFQTADGRYDPAPSVKDVEKYSPADIEENPTLADMTRAALSVLEHDPEGFWLMVEAGDVDWANHANNLDNSIGATLSGDDAFRAVVEWIEARKAWDDTAVILTADHGHFLVLDKPEVLIQK